MLGKDTSTLIPWDCWNPGAAQAGYSLEEVESVVHALYSNPSNVAEANAWLVHFMNSEVRMCFPKSLWHPENVFPEKFVAS